MITESYYPVNTCRRRLWHVAIKHSVSHIMLKTDIFHLLASCYESQLSCPTHSLDPMDCFHCGTTNVTDDTNEKNMNFIYVLYPLRTWSVMAHHKFLSLVVLSNVRPLTISLSSAIHWYKIDRYVILYFSPPDSKQRCSCHSHFL